MASCTLYDICICWAWIKSLFAVVKVPCFVLRAVMSILKKVLDWILDASNLKMSQKNTWIDPEIDLCKESELCEILFNLPRKSVWMEKLGVKLESDPWKFKSVL